jgi:alginate export protein
MYVQGPFMALRGSVAYKQFFYRRVVGMLLCGLFFARGTAVGQNSSPGDPCSYRLPHYEEDWSCVNNGLHNADPSDAIKDVALGERQDSSISFGGEIRETYERFRNPNFGLQPQDPNGYLLQRYLVHADLHVKESLRAYVEVLSAFENWRVGGPRPTVDEDKLEVHQGFLDFYFGNEQDERTAVRLGRQEMALGSGRLVALREGTNVPFRFDGIRAEFHRGSWRLNVFATKPVQNRIGFFDDPPQAGAWFWGVYASRVVQIDGHAFNFDLYYLGLDRNPGVFNQGSAQETRHTFGARMWNFKGAWNYDAEGIFQFGTFGGGDIRAFRVASDISYGFASARWQPRLGLAADVASGDRDPSHPNLQTFNALFQSGTYSGKAQILGPANTIRIEPSLKASPRATVLISAGWGFYWRESIHDGLYGIAGNLLVPGNTSRARYEGNRPILQADWQMNRHLSAHVNYIYVFNGPFGQQAIHGTSSMSYVSPWLTYEF